MNQNWPNMEFSKEIINMNNGTYFKILIKNSSRLIVFYVITILLLVIGAPEPVMAKSAGFTIEQILSAPFPSSLTASPRGDRLAWVFSDRGVKNIWTAKVPGFKSRRLTEFSSDDGRPLFINGFSMVDCATGKLEEIVKAGRVGISPAGAQLAYVEKNELYFVSPGKKPEKKMSARGHLRLSAWSPGGKRVLLVSFRGEFPHRYSFIMVYNPEQDKVTYIDASVYLDSNPCWSPDGKKIVFLRRLTHGHRGIITARTFPVPDPYEIRVADVNTGETHRAWRSPDSDTIYNTDIAWLDNNSLVFTSEADGWCHLYTVPAAGGNARQLTKGRFEVENFTAVPGLKKIFFTCNAGDIDRRHTWSVGIDGRKKALTGGESIEWNPVPTGDNKYIAFFGSTAALPARVFIKPVSGGKRTALAKETMPGDFPKNLITPRQVIFKAVDGVEIHGQLFDPPKTFKGKRPAVMFFHGGPVRQMLLGFHYSSYYHRAYAMNQYLASRGYVVLTVNFRLGVGYGRAFREVPDGGPRGCSEYRDLLAGAKYLRGLKNVDPGRIGLWGGSYGGLMTALGLARNSDLFAAGVDFHGVHDWNQWQAWADNRENDKNQVVWKSSPLADVANWRSPVLLIHGDDDRNVPFFETVWLAEKLIKQGVECELLIFPDEVHSFLLHRNWVRAFKAAVSFFDRKLKLH